MSKNYSPFIFNGDFAKAIKANLKLDENVFVITDQSADPTAVAYSAPIGSLYFRSGTSEVYKKLDAGSSTNWKLLETSAIEALGAITKEPTGFPNRTDSALTYTDGTRTFQIAPTGSSFTVYLKGKKIVVSSPLTVVWTNVEGGHYFYIDTNGALQHSTTFSIDFLSEYVYVSYLYWDATNSVSICRGEERHGMLMDSETHKYLHKTRKTVWETGLGLSDFTITGGNPTGATEAQFDVSAGTIWDEDINFDISSVNNLSGIPIFYREGASGVWRRQAASGFGVRFVTSRAAFNQFTGAVWQQTEVTSNGDYVLAHLVATTCSANPLLFIQGQNQYTSLTTASTGAANEVNSLALAGLPFEEFKFIATVIYQTNSGYTNNSVRSKIVNNNAGSPFTDFRFSGGLTSAGVATDHGNLSGLGDNDHPQYVESPLEITNLRVACSVGSNALTIAAQGFNGVALSSSNYAIVNFPILDNGSGYTTATITSLTSLVVPSGATLGHGNSLACPIYVYLQYNAGTPELAVSSSLLDEGTLQTSTTIDTGADLSSLYAATGRSSQPIRLIATLYSTQTTAGTWAANVTKAVPVGLGAYALGAQYTASSTSDGLQATPTADTFYIPLSGVNVTVPPGTYNFQVKGVTRLDNSVDASIGTISLQLGTSSTPGSGMIGDVNTVGVLNRVPTSATTVIWTPFSTYANNITFTSATTVYVNVRFHSVANSAVAPNIGFSTLDTNGISLRLTATRIA